MKVRKVYVEVLTRLIIRINEGIDLCEVFQNMDYNFTSQTEGADIEDTETLAEEIIDSK